MDPHNDEHRYRRGHDFESRPGLNFQAFHSVLLKWHSKTVKVINNSLLCRKYINGTLNLLTSQYILSELGSSETALTKRCLLGSTALGMR